MILKNKKAISIAMVGVILIQISYPLMNNVEILAQEILPETFDVSKRQEAPEEINQASNESVSFEKSREINNEKEIDKEESNEEEINKIKTKEVTPQGNKKTNDSPAEEKEIEETDTTVVSENIEAKNKANSIEGFKEYIKNEITSEEEYLLNVDFKNITNMDIEIMSNIYDRIKSKGLIQEYLSNINGEWTPGDPITDLIDHNFSQGSWDTNLVFGTKFYQGQEFPNYSDGKYYVYRDPNTALGEGVSQYDLSGFYTGDVGPNQPEPTNGSAPYRGQLCPYLKDESPEQPENKTRTTLAPDGIEIGNCDYVSNTTNVFYRGTNGTESYDKNMFGLKITGRVETEPYKVTAVDVEKPDGSGAGGFQKLDQYGDYKFHFRAEPVIKDNTVLAMMPDVDFTGVNNVDDLLDLPPEDLQAVWFWLLLDQFGIIDIASGSTVNIDVLRTSLAIPGDATVEVVDDKQLFSINDIRVNEMFAPQSDAQLVNLANYTFIEPEHFVDREGVDHVGDVYNKNNSDYIVDLEGTGYDYANPRVGTYNIPVTAISPTTGFEQTRVITLDVTNYGYGESRTGELLTSTPITVDTNEGIYDALLKANPITIKYKNGVLDTVIDETLDENFSNLSIIETDNREVPGELSTPSGRHFYRIASNHDGLFYESVIEVQKTWDKTPITDEITIESIDDLTLQTRYDFDPVVSSNSHAYNSHGDEEELDVRTTQGLTEIDTTGKKVRQYVLESENEEAYGVKLINMNVIDVEEGQMPLIAARDANVRSVSTPKTEDELLELMAVKALDIDGTDITDQIKVFNLGEFEYGDKKLNGTPYKITLGVTSPLTGITVTQTKDLYIIGNDESVPRVELTGNNPIYVKAGDGTTAKDITNIISPNVVVTLNHNFFDASDAKVTLLDNDAYNNNQVGSYYFLYDGIYNENKSDVDPMSAQNIFEVIVSDDVKVTQAAIAIEAPENTKLVVGDSFDAIAGVSAASIVDGDITSSVEVLQNEVNTSEAGTYGVTYYVKDTEDKEAYKTVEVQVYDTEEELNNSKDRESNEVGTNISTNNKDEEGFNSEMRLVNTAKTNIFSIVYFIFLALGTAFVFKK